VENLLKAGRKFSVADPGRKSSGATSLVSLVSEPLLLIPRATVDKIIDAAHIEAVVGEFVTLKKRGANLLGLCPFHGEKTPSFTVSPAKGIYKCFGCGKAGGSVNFVMDHLSLSYPEALKWLAAKYGIEVEEKEFTPEEKKAQTERESMLIVMQYSARYFAELMHQNDEGQSVGLAYFRKRGLRDDILAKFQLGYSLEDRNAFSRTAVEKGYQPEYLVKTGMSLVSRNHVEGTPLKAADLFDRYAGRVMFPITDDSGRVVAFGGRTLSTEKKVAKYVNSPETDIYNKSRILYGLSLAKKAIQQNDSCFLVEGYMDVIAMHQAGIENVVASSGTSLTIEQIKSIHRFTSNIIVLYDGDEAGQKASNRAIPLLLEEGMNVKLLQFPGNDDPDSFSRKVSSEEFHSYIRDNSIDFIHYKAKKLGSETQNDPIRRAMVIKDIVENIGLIPDNIIRSVYVKECASIMSMEEQVLQAEVNRIRRKLAQKASSARPPEAASDAPPQDEEPASFTLQPEENEPVFNYDAEEEKLLTILLKFGNLLITTQAEDEVNVEHELQITLGEFIIFELWRDSIVFENPLYRTVLDEYIKLLSEQKLPDLKDFQNSPDPLISGFVVNNVLDRHDLSPRWVDFGVSVPRPVDVAKKDAERALFSYKSKKLHQFIIEKRESLKAVDYQDGLVVLDEIRRLDGLKMRVNKLLGREVIK
jgi:DNA primase